MHSPHAQARPRDAYARSPRSAQRWQHAAGAVLVALALFSTGCALAQQPPLLPVQTTGVSTREQAFAAYERNQWPEAFAAFLRLAEAGDADGQRIVLLMVRHGQQLYGRPFEISAQQRASWPSPSARP